MIVNINLLDSSAVLPVFGVDFDVISRNNLKRLACTYYNNYAVLSSGSLAGEVTYLLCGRPARVYKHTPAFLSGFAFAGMRQSYY